MTQALNLANFANNLNTSGQTSNSGLQNSSITVTAGTGLSGGGTPALGGSVTINNAGVTSVAAGTGISVSASTGGVTITNSAPAVTAGEAKAWVNYNASSQTIRASYNVSSVTYNSTGNFTINFTSSLADANYSVSGTAWAPGSYGGAVGINSQSASSLQIQAVAINGTAPLSNPTYVCVSVFR